VIKFKDNLFFNSAKENRKEIKWIAQQELIY